MTSPVRTTINSAILGEDQTSSGAPRFFQDALSPLRRLGALFAMPRRWLVASICLGLLVWAAALGMEVRPIGYSGHARVASALGANRFIEPRLGGGFAFAPCAPVEIPDRLIPAARCSQAPRSGEPEHAKLVLAIGHAVRSAESSQGAADFPVSGIASLAWPTIGESPEGEVEQLALAVSRTPHDVQLRNDLTVARFLLAQQEDEPTELVRALSDAQEAYEIDPSVPEVLFNRALILERLFLRDQAIAAWEGYQKIDPGSGWGEEAQQHLNRLRRTPAPELWKKQLPELDTVAETGDGDRVRQIVALSPQQAREYALEDLLGSWGDLQAMGRTQEAASLLRVARALGQALSELTGDSVVAATVNEIDRAMTDPSAGRLGVLVRGHRALREGVHLARDQLLKNAGLPLQEAYNDLGQEGSPAAYWALLAIAGSRLSEHRYVEAIQTYEALERAAERLPSPILVARAEWGIGIAHVRQGHFAESLHHYQLASARLVSRGETEGLGAVHEAIAENLRFLGQSAAAWRYRYRAASELAPYRNSFRLHTMLWEAGWAAVEDGCPKAALLIQQEGVQVAARTGQPHWLAEALVWKSKIHLALGSPQAALAALADALAQNANSPGAEVKQRVWIDATYMQGEALRSLKPLKAITSLSQAVQLYLTGNLPLDLAGAYLSRARAYLSVGRYEEAESDLTAAIDLFESQRASVGDNSSRLSYSEAAQGLFDEMILLKADRKVDPAAALMMAERARTVPLSGTQENLPIAPAVVESLDEIPSNVALIEYAIVRNRLFIWVLRHGKLDFVRRKIAPAELADLVKSLVVGIRTQASPRRLDGISTRLHEILIPRELEIPAEIELGFVPDRSLHGLPFAALKDPVSKKYLIEKHTIRVLPSIARYLSLRKNQHKRRGPAPDALLIGATEWDQTLLLPALPSVAKEIEEIQGVYHNPRVVVGAGVTKERLLAELDSSEVLQIAGHAVYNPRHPEHSYFVLAPSKDDTGLLFASEIAGRHFTKLRLIVLAACSTLGPLDSRTSGLSGLARPFLDGGVPAVVGTLWNVSDQAAERLMMGFHRRYLTTGDAAGALREAQLSLLRSGDSLLDSPAAWAGYQVAGAGD